VFKHLRRVTFKGTSINTLNDEIITFMQVVLSNCTVQSTLQLQGMPFRTTNAYLSVNCMHKYCKYTGKV